MGGAPHGWSSPWAELPVGGAPRGQSFPWAELPVGGAELPVGGASYFLALHPPGPGTHVLHIC